MTSTKPSALSANDLDFYRKNGYLKHDRLLRPDRFEALKAHFERKLAELPEGERPENMDVPHFSDPELFHWLLDEDVLDLIEAIIGPDIAVFSSHFFCKPAGDGKSVPWHQDAYFWRETIEPASRAITVWLALDPSTQDNGCMRVIPGSHLADATRYRDVNNAESVFDEELDPAQVEQDRAVPVELMPNQCSVHSGTLVHGSHINASTMRRCAYTMRYMPTTVRFNHERLGHKHAVFLARGTDRAGNTYADPTRPHWDLVRNRGGGQRYLGEQRNPRLTG
ncbi:MAG TPA: phytanoyl-CoA dioxygenase family protein [Actinophytocola sp.]|jgi:hypothetical protein|uniref:phytanoyl-CoA dioxygenase family protein n=1 Tax=Actinophytocola sp. TaxID=1872138 RepID=UPI002E0530A4|nr:phytanoyl-CoA dioxygenase family protein [Actinophytocola sp.]